MDFSILRFNRTISSRLARFLASTPVTPNAVTAAGLVSGLVAAWLLSFGSRLSMVSAVFFLHAAFVLDSCDGDLARLTGRQTEFGRWFDVFSDIVVDLALWCGLWFAVAALGRPGTSTTIYLAAACAGSLLNFALIVWERKRGCSFHVADEADINRKKNGFFIALESFAHNGVSIVLAYAVAFFGSPEVFLLCAALFVNILWMTRVCVNFDRLGLRRPAMFGVKMAAWAVGAYVFWRTYEQVSWPALSSLLKSGGLSLLFVLGVYPLVCVFHALGFYCLFSPATRANVGFSRIYGIFLQGDALNKVTPLVDVGGEPAKVMMLQKSGKLFLSESIHVVYLSRVVLVISELVMMVIGTALAVVFWPSSFVLGVGLVSVAITAIFLGILFYSSSAMTNALCRIAVGAQLEKRDLAGLNARIQNGLRRFYSTKKLVFLSSLFWNEVAWVILLFEIYFTLTILGARVSILDAFILHAVLRCVQTATFFIPLNLGSQESGMSYLASHIGLTSALGLAVSLIKRLRQFVYGAISGACVALAARKGSVQTAPAVLSEVVSR